MKFAITKSISSDVVNKFIYHGYSVDVRVNDHLSKKFYSMDYGKGLDTLYIGLSCLNPKMLIPHRDFETGFLINKKYVGSKKYLEFKVKLNHLEVSLANSQNELIDIISEALMKSYSEIEILDINDFDIGKFYTDLKSLLKDRSWLDEPYVEQEFHYQLQNQKSKAKFSDDEKMKEDSFWELIEKSRIDSKYNFYKQVEIITNKLTEKPQKEIIGFECTLRELLIKANHYNVMAVQKIVEGTVTDDSFLYFRCKLILYGRLTFENAITNPNHIFERIDPIISGEPLLTIADTAFNMKFGKNNDKVLPRDYGSEIINYDSGDYEVQGKKWEESDIPKRYSKLWKTYLK